MCSGRETDPAPRVAPVVYMFYILLCYCKADGVLCSVHLLNLFFIARFSLCLYYCTGLYLSKLGLQNIDKYV